MKYDHEETVWCIFDENRKIMGVIGYSAIHHVEESEIKFVRYKVFYKTHWDAELILIQNGELRWDGFITGVNNPSVMHRGMDDLSSYIYMQFLVYYIAQEEIFSRDLEKRVEKHEMYYSLSQDILETDITPGVSYIEYEYIKTNLKLESIYNKCVSIKEELTEMSINALSNIEEGDNEDDDR